MTRLHTAQDEEVVLYDDQINSRALIGQSAMVYCGGKLMDNCASSELLYKRNRLQVCMVYRLINRKEEFVNHSPAARDLRILLVF